MELKIDVAEVARQVLAERQPGEDIDEALLRVCKRMFGGSATAVFQALQGAVSAVANQDKISPESAIRNLAGGIASVSVTTQTTRSVSVESLDELPPDLRSEVEKALASGKSGSVVITKTVSGQGEVSPAAPVQREGTPGSRCAYCGYELASNLASCPQCGKAQKRSFWSRLFKT